MKPPLAGAPLCNACSLQTNIGFPNRLRAMGTGVGIATEVLTGLDDGHLAALIKTFLMRDNHCLRYNDAGFTNQLKEGDGHGGTSS